MNENIVDTRSGFLVAWTTQERSDGMHAQARVLRDEGGVPGREVAQVSVGPCATADDARLLALGECRWRIDNGLRAA
jgi:hypothetical protein